MEPTTPAAKPVKERSNAVRGILWMILASLCFACMHAVIKKVAQTGIHPFETAFFRLLFGMLPIIPFFVRDGLKPLKTKRLGLLTLRGVLNSGAMMCYFFALSIAPLAQVTALGFSAPIFASVLAMLFLGEVIRLRRWTAILFGFAGTLVILRPGVIPLELGPMLVIISSLVWGCCMIIIKRLSATESSATITVYMSLVMMPILLVPASFVWTWPGLEQWGLLIGLGILGGGAQMSMAQALKMADTHVVGPIDFVRLVWVTALGYLFFNELPDLFVWIGGAMILGSTAYIAYREHRLGKDRVEPGPPGVR